MANHVIEEILQATARAEAKHPEEEKWLLEFFLTLQNANSELLWSIGHDTNKAARMRLLGVAAVVVRALKNDALWEEK